MSRAGRNVSPVIRRTISVTVAQIQAAGHKRISRLRRNANGVAPLAELAITKPDITKKISTPTQPIQATGVSASNFAAPAKMTEIEEYSDAQT